MVERLLRDVFILGRRGIVRCSFFLCAVEKTIGTRYIDALLLTFVIALLGVCTNRSDQPLRALRTAFRVCFA